MKRMAAGVWAAAGILVCGAAGSMAQEGGAAPAPATNAPARISMRDAMSFQAMDINKDGKVTMEEYQAAMAAVAKQRFESMDANKDGVLSEAEMNAGRFGGPRRSVAPARSGDQGGRGDSGAPAKGTEGGAAK